ncbi:hypothetical protein CLV78_104282 [Aliiruegeria haliotis]|uniref:Uncharacterized protein n=1 Tax=Aliiruegeria haliotis TaxID=1280846 RepID=A0A2T0RRQ9_9RHOB|nr:hypothetical protein CLV78_104282 [Aliiruegeria haliotis]
MSCRAGVSGVCRGRHLVLAPRGLKPAVLEFGMASPSLPALPAPWTKWLPVHARRVGSDLCRHKLEIGQSFERWNTEGDRRSDRYLKACPGNRRDRRAGSTRAATHGAAGAGVRPFAGGYGSAGPCSPDPQRSTTAFGMRIRCLGMPLATRNDEASVGADCYPCGKTHRAIGPTRPVPRPRPQRSRAWACSRPLAPVTRLSREWPAPEAARELRRHGRAAQANRSRGRHAERWGGNGARGSLHRVPAQSEGRLPRYLGRHVD